MEIAVFLMSIVIVILVITIGQLEKKLNVISDLLIKHMTSDVLKKYKDGLINKDQFEKEVNKATFGKAKVVVMGDNNEDI